MVRPTNGRCALGALAAAGLLAACSPSPCTACLAVEGSYAELTQSASVDCGDQRRLYFGGGTASASVAQTGSALALAALGGFHLTGVLHQDGSASFGPVPATAEPVDSSGNPDPNGTPTPGKLYLEGWFTAGASGASAFDGTYLFIADPDGCEVDSHAQWRR